MVNSCKGVHIGPLYKKKLKILRNMLIGVKGLKHENFVDLNHSYMKWIEKDFRLCLQRINSKSSLFKCNLKISKLDEINSINLAFTYYKRIPVPSNLINWQSMAFCKQRRKQPSPRIEYNTWRTDGSRSSNTLVDLFYAKNLDLKT